MRGIIVGGMVIGLLMGCNNGGELEAQKRLGEIGRSAENVFYSFIDLISGTLGFTVTKETTKQQVGQYFTDLGKQLEKASNGLEEVAKKAETGDEKSDSSKNLIREAVDAAKATLNTLKGHLESLKDIGDSDKVGVVGASQQGKAVNKEKLEATYDGLNGIVEIATKEGVEKPKKNDLTISAAKVGATTPQNGAKVLTTGAHAGAEVGDKASLIVFISEWRSNISSYYWVQERRCCI